MADVVVNTKYSEMLRAYGLPYRMFGKRDFSIRKHLQPYTAGDRVIDPRKQTESYQIAEGDETGWLMFACSATILEYPRHVAASIMNEYHHRGLRSQWLATFDKLDKVPFQECSLLVIDALFFDSSSFRRDKVYEVINHYGNVKDLSICVVGQYIDPIAMASHLGMKPDLALSFK